MTTSQLRNSVKRSSWRRGFFLIPLVLGCFTLSPAVRAANNGQFSCVSLTGNSFFNPCTGEDILITDGEVCIAANTRFDKTGGVHFSFQFTSHFTAVGQTSGRTYVENNAAGENDNFSVRSFQYEFTFRQHYHVNTSGPDNTLYITELTHATFNANGELTSFKVVDIFLGCK